MKKTSKKKRDPAPAPRMRSFKDMKAYFHNLDLIDLWEKWDLSIQKNGAIKWRSIANFCHSVTTNEEEYNFLHWLLGPDKNEKDLQEKYAFAGRPLDWKHKRDTGGWYHPDKLKAVRTRMDSLESLKEVGNEAVLPSIQRFERMAEQLDREMRGKFFDDELPPQENRARAAFYLQAHQQILALKAGAVDTFAKTQGINFEDLGGYAHLLAAATLSAQNKGDQKHQRLQSAVDQIINMTLNKAARYDLPVPEEMKGRLIEMKSHPEEMPPKKKVN